MQATINYILSFESIQLVMLEGIHSAKLRKLSFLKLQRRLYCHPTIFSVKIHKFEGLSSIIY